MTPSSGAPHEACRLLRLYLSEQGRSTERLARELGWEVETVEDLLDGRSALELGVLEDVLRALEVPPLEFFRRLYREQALVSEVEDDVDEPLTRDEVEALVAEMRKRLQGARRSLEARNHEAERELCHPPRPPG